MQTDSGSNHSSQAATDAAATSSEPSRAAAQLLENTARDFVIVACFAGLAIAVAVVAAFPSSLHQMQRGDDAFLRFVLRNRTRHQGMHMARGLTSRPPRSPQASACGPRS